jgi:NADH-quinone oxidoreductase subunit N
VLTLPDLVALLPLLAIGAVVVALMVTIAFVRRHRAVLALTLVGLAATLATLPVAATADQPQVTALLRVDAYALFFIGLLTLTTGAVALLAYGYLRGGEAEPPEFYLLLCIALLGAATMTASTHFASFFLGLEILSVSLYTLIAYPRVRLGCIEASVKYLILGGVTSAFLLFGMALFYAAAGTMTVPGLTAALNEGTVEVGGQTVTPDGLLVLTGLALVLVSVGFKLALVPFHMWTPDIYQGAPAPVTAFVATVSKGATVALLVRYFRGVDLAGEPALFWAFTLLAGASMIAGNLLALLQTNLKRLLAYSSIAHLGYVLVAFLGRARGHGGELLRRRLRGREPGRLRHRHRAVEPGEGRRGDRRLPRPRRAATLARRRHGAGALLARRPAAHGRLHRQVLPGARRRR